MFLSVMEHIANMLHAALESCNSPCLQSLTVLAIATRVDVIHQPVGHFGSLALPLQHDSIRRMFSSSTCGGKCFPLQQGLTHLDSTPY